MMCDGHVDPRVSMEAGETTGVIHEDMFSHNEIHMIIVNKIFSETSISYHVYIKIEFDIKSIMLQWQIV